MASHPLVRHFNAIFQILGRRIRGAWRRYRALRPRYQILLAILFVAALFALSALLTGGSKNAAPEQLRTVTLSPIGELSGNNSGASVIGTVRAVSEAAIRAETSGTVEGVYTRIGSFVAAGSILAELENSAQRAAVLQAEGAYDAALANRASVSPEDSVTAARNAYRNAYTSLDTTLENDIDDFFGGPTPTGPALLINPAGSDSSRLSRERADIERLMNTWNGNLADADRRDPENLLGEAEGIARTIQTFADSIADAANRTDSRATPEQLASLAAARATIAGVLSSLTQAQAAFRSGSTSSTASVDAGVKSALGTLRLAQSNLERTVVRAPIAGTVNFLPVRVGEYVSALQHVATVAQNGALEIIAYVSEEERDALTVGAKVQIEDKVEGIITAISPALDPVNRQIEVRIAVSTSADTFVNGQSVRVTLPGVIREATVSGPILLPLSSVKLSAGKRVVFTVSEGVLVAIQVEIGEVRGERLEITTTLDANQEIVTDARGLAEGQPVNVANGE